jgi:putative membrane protein
MAPWSGAGGAGVGGVVLPAPLGLLLVVALLVAVPYLSRSGLEPAGPDRATELLRERYARGEIGDEEFERRTGRLSGDAGGSSTAR